MKIRFSFVEAVAVALVVGAAAYALTAWDPSILFKLRAWFPSQQSAPAPAASASLPPALAKQVPRCRKEGPGFQACMFAAGYAVNTAWTDAHNKDPEGAAGTPTPARAGEVLADPYRIGPSPVYGVPYWVPRK
ncbi:MAG TPA: hypothetical protein VF816_15750 [Rhodocyclaceae bacterium]